MDFFFFADRLRSGKTYLARRRSGRWWGASCWCGRPLLHGLSVARALHGPFRYQLVGLRAMRSIRCSHGGTVRPPRTHPYIRHAEQGEADTQTHTAAGRGGHKINKSFGNARFLLDFSNDTIFRSLGLHVHTHTHSQALTHARLIIPTHL